MKIVITEEQYKEILIESNLKDTLNDLKINSGILFTFGTGIGAFIGPVERLLSGSGFSMDEKDIILLIITSFALIIKNSGGVTLLEKVREKGLMPALKGVINFVTNVKDVLNAVSKNLIGVTYSLLDILGFVLLLNPTMKIIDEVIKNNGIGLENTERLLSGVILATIVYSLKSLFGKLKNKIKGNVNEDILKFGNFMYGENGDLGLKRKYEKYKSIKNYTDSKETYTCYKNNEVVKSFDSLKSASDWVNRGRYVGVSINDSIIGRQPTAYGYKWYKVKTQ